MKLRNMDIQRKLDDKNLQFEIVNYTKYTKPSIFKHKICQKEFSTRLDHLLERQRCLCCESRKRDIERFQIESDKKHNYQYQILELENGNRPVKIKHKICGIEFYQVGYRHLRGDGCPECFRNKKYTKNELIDLSNKRWNGDYEILSDIVEYDKKSLIKHKCGYEFHQLVSSHINGLGCPKCAGNAPHTRESIQERSDIVHDKEYIILSDPDKGKRSLLRILHKECSKEFSQVASDHLSGCGCTHCKSSKGEKSIEKILNNKNINYIKQKTFDGCKFKNKLKFDFYLPDMNTCIEYDGQQHFFPINYFGGKKAFELQKIKDKIKETYCIDNNIKLLRIKYDMNYEIIEENINNL